jgi:hypothetical protein
VATLEAAKVELETSWQRWPEWAKLGEVEWKRRRVQREVNFGRIENAMGSRLISGTSMNKIIEISICMQGGNHSQSTACSQVEPYLDPSYGLRPIEGAAGTAPLPAELPWHKRYPIA